MSQTTTPVEELEVLSEDESTDKVSKDLREVDVLDLMMIESVTRKERTRGAISETFDISRDMARNRLENLFERKLIAKAEMCKSCEELLNECECGSFNKVNYYFREGDEEEAQLINKVRKLVQSMEEENDLELVD